MSIRFDIAGKVDALWGFSKKLELEIDEALTKDHDVCRSRAPYTTTDGICPEKLRPLTFGDDDMVSLALTECSTKLRILLRDLE